MLKKYKTNLLRTSAVIGYVTLFSTLLINNANAEACQCTCSGGPLPQFPITIGGLSQSALQGVCQYVCQRFEVNYVQCK
jgi:hypothetical protein